MPRKKKTEEEKLAAIEKKKQNLMPVEVLNSIRTPEQRRADASKGGKKSVEVRRRNRMMMDMARKILEMPVGERYGNIKSMMQTFGIPEDDMNYGTAMLAVIAVKAMSGDINAAKYVRDSAGMDSMTVLKEEQFEWEKENGQKINVSLDGEVTTKSRVQIYLPERDEDPE